MAVAGSAIPFFVFVFVFSFGCCFVLVILGSIVMSGVFQRFQQYLSTYISQPWNSVNGQSFNLGSGYNGSGHDEQSREYIGVNPFDTVQ